MLNDQCLVSVDNGQEWSDHQTYPVLICETEAAAKAAVAAFNKWKSDMIDKFYDEDGLSYGEMSIGDYRMWCAINPCPLAEFRIFAGDMAFCKDVRKFTADYMPLPTWA